MNLLYGYDLTDHVVSRSDTAPGVARADTYAIDGLGRLTGWTRSECRGSVVSPCSPGRTLRDTSYGYDLGGDLISTSTGYFGRVPARPKAPIARWTSSESSSPPRARPSDPSPESRVVPCESRRGSFGEPTPALPVGSSSGTLGAGT